MEHKPVLLEEVIGFLDPKPGEFFIDGTLNGGGHTASIIERMMPEGKFLALDWDKDILERTQKRIEAKFKIPSAGRRTKFQILWINDNFRNLPMILKSKKLEKADGLILDLGFSSEQLESSKRGFSFLRDEPLDMRYSADNDIEDDRNVTAAEVINTFDEDALAEIFKKYGEERYARRIARAIKKNLPVMTTKKLVDVIMRSVPRNYERGRIHPATRTFQALRIFVNQELENLKVILNHISEVLNPGGRAVIISFHSLEDRIVKHTFRDLVKEDRAELLTKKPVVPSKAEVLNNPRSRSAKLRALKII